jgi:hypothetical protein
MRWTTAIICMMCITTLASSQSHADMSLGQHEINLAVMSTELGVTMYEALLPTIIEMSGTPVNIPRDLDSIKQTIAKLKSNLDSFNGETGLTLIYQTTQMIHHANTCMFVPVSAVAQDFIKQANPRLKVAPSHKLNETRMSLVTRCLEVVKQLSIGQELLFSRYESWVRNAQACKAKEQANP